MERTPINPVEWSLKLGFDQGQLIEGARRQLVVSGQDELVKHWSSLVQRFGDSEERFVTSLLGVTRLFTPELLVMLEATAVD